MQAIVRLGVVVALLVASGAELVGTVSPVAAQQRVSAPSMMLPDALKRAAIATRSDRHGKIAGAQIGKTGVYVVYLRTNSGCGSGGCRAQLWKHDGSRFIQRGLLVVGHLPIVVFPERSSGMQDLGVSTFDKNKGHDFILPLTFDGKNYIALDYDRLLPAGSGKSLLTEEMMRPF